MLSLNNRGLKNISTVRNLKAFLRSCNPQISFLTETLIGGSNSQKLYNSLCFYKFNYVPTVGRSGVNAWFFGIMILIWMS